MILLSCVFFLFLSVLQEVCQFYRSFKKNLDLCFIDIPYLADFNVIDFCYCFYSIFHLFAFGLFYSVFLVLEVEPEISDLKFSPCSNVCTLVLAFFFFPFSFSCFPVDY